MSIDIILSKIQKYVVFAFIVLFPIFVPLISTAPYAFPRLVLLAFSVSLLIVLWFLGEIANKDQGKFVSGKFDLAVLVFVLAYALSAAFQTPNKMDAFLLPGTASFVILGGLLYFLVNQLKDAEEGLTFSLIISSVVASLAVLATELGLLAKLSFLPAFIKDATFTPLGGTIPTILYLVAILILALVRLVKEKDLVKRVFILACGVVVLLGIGLSVKTTIKQGTFNQSFSDLNTSWQITFESLKRFPIWGVGPGNYLTAFSGLRPVTFNQSVNWPVKFAAARNFYLTQVTETGLVGLFALSLLLFTIYKFIGRSINGNEIPLVSVLIIFALFPAAGSLLILFFLFLSLATSGHTHSKSLGSSTSLALAALPFFMGVIALGYLGTKAVKAELSFQKAIEAYAGNNAKAVYDNLNAAESTNPYVDRYRIAYSQVDMTLASNIASKKDITDNDRTLVTQLIQHAISDGKAAVVLNSQKSSNWQNLASIYRAVMPFAQGADQFAVQTYSQAVALDPYDPNIRIALGGVYYALGRYDDAIDAFKLAILAKPDLANAHYNLAIAYRDKKDYDNAISEMNTVLSLLPKDSQDYTLAKNTLDQIEKNKPATQPAGGENLTPPQTQQETNIKPPIELPQEATPPAANTIPVAPATP